MPLSDRKVSHLFPNRQISLPQIQKNIFVAAEMQKKTPE